MKWRKRKPMKGDNFTIVKSAENPEAKSSTNSENSSSLSHQP